MTQEEKHALIAERLEGWTHICKHVTVYASSNGRYSGKQLLNHATGQWVPDYSSDLNLCARVEAKIAGMGEQSQYDYTIALLDAVGSCKTFNVLSAPASARVDAMVALIQSMEPKS